MNYIITMLSIITIYACGTVGHHQHRSKNYSKHDTGSWGIEKKEFASRSCGQYFFIYADGALNGYLNLDHFIFYKTNYDSASRIVAGYCINEGR